MILPKKILMAFLIAVVSILPLTIPAFAAGEEYILEILPNPPIWINTEVTATATTDDPRVDQVVFEWTDPHGVTVETFTDTSAPFEHSYTPNELGEWKVTANFGEGVQKVAYIRVVVTIIPQLGTMMILIASFAAFAAFATRRRL